MRFAIALGVGAALTLAVAPSAEAQSTTGNTRRVTSSQRIPLRKGETTTSEASGVVENADSIARADSIAAEDRARQEALLAAQRAYQDSVANAERMRQDSIAAIERARQDSIAMVERMRQDSIARADSIAAARAAMKRLPRSMYFSIGGGASMPRGVLNDGYKTGFNGTASLGWNPPSLPFGLRFDGTYDRFRGRDLPIVGKLDDLNVWSGLAEATLGIPLTIARLSPYIVGGGGVYRFSSSGSNSDATTKGGWNAGGGVNFSFGRTNLFLESRYMRVSTPDDPSTFVPVILGLTFR